MKPYYRNFTVFGETVWFHFPLPAAILTNAETRHASRHEHLINGLDPETCNAPTESFFNLPEVQEEVSAGTK